MDTIDGMRTFVAVARQKSFTSGAKSLGISTKLASKYVLQLEERLGAQLFNRTTRSVGLTETGRAYLNRCVPLLDQLDELEGLVQERQADLAGTIRITAPTGFGSSKLVEAIHPFQLAHPHVKIDLHLSDQHIALIEEGFDLAIRFGELEDSSLVARKLMNMRVVVVASPSYLANYGEPKQPQDLTEHNCLLQRFSSDTGSWKFNVDGEKVTVPVTGSFYSNAPRAIAQATIGGLGIGMCPLYAVEEALARGELKCLFEAEEASAINLHAVYPPGRHLTARIRALIDHLVEVF
jgi:DNA-binding transcriptional LysR family regulator